MRVAGGLGGELLIIIIIIIVVVISIVSFVSARIVSARDLDRARSSVLVCMYEGASSPPAAIPLEARSRCWRKSLALV